MHPLPQRLPHVGPPEFRPIYQRQDYIMDQQYQQQQLHLQQQHEQLLQLQLAQQLQLQMLILQQLQLLQLQLQLQQLQLLQQPAIKKDKRRQTILNKLTKLEEKFYEEKDLYYRANLHDLQLSLSTLHNHTNAECLVKIQDYRELRDAELTRLRLSEEYLVYRTTNLFKQEYEKTQESYDNLIKQVKNKLYEKINKKIINLKQDKLLMDVSTSMTQINYSNLNGSSNGGSLTGVTNSRSRRREDSQRKRAAIETDYDSGYDSTGYTSQQQTLHEPHSNSSRKKKTSSQKITTDDDLEQMDELDELLNGDGSETTGGYHSTRAQIHHITSGNKKHKTVLDSLKLLDEDEISYDLKMLKNV